jgi:hypothetical protein
MKPTIRPMQIRDAKDFLVTQTAEQAAIEGVQLSDLEKRMMYFTETGECPEDPVALNEEFEKEYENDEYETKVKKLLANAHRRLKEERSPAVEEWEESLKVLDQTDDYILILCDRSPLARFGNREALPAVLLFVFRLGLLVVAAYLVWNILKFLLRITGISGASLFGTIFVITLLAVAIRPQIATELTARPMTWLTVFLFKKRDSDANRTG